MVLYSMAPADIRKEDLAMSDNQTTTWLGLAWLGLAWLGLAVALHCSLSLSSLIFPIFCKKPLPKTGDIMPCLRFFCL